MIAGTFQVLPES